MLNRRNFMLASGAGFASYGLPCWGTEQPTFLSCGKNSHGRFVVCGISHRGKIIFETVLPSRGHEAVFHPKVPMAVIFGRRPGYFATVIDILKGEVIAILEPQRERHFFGHGTFSSDGKTLYTTENDYVSGRGIIGVWSVFPFKRRSEFFSGGVGPHDITLIDEGDTLVVANGGLRTHPKTGRQVLNSDNFISNLSYFTTNGECLEIVSLAEKFVSLSIRHLSAGSDNSIAFAMQDQEKFSILPLIGIHKRGQTIKLLSAPTNLQRKLHGYIGSVAFDQEAKLIAATSPKIGVVHIFSVINAQLKRSVSYGDVCGVTGIDGGGFIATTGTGCIYYLGDRTDTLLSEQSVWWDNHIEVI